jgi:hypothetical protein
MAGSDENHDRSRRSRGWVALCAVCTVHVETRSAGFLAEPQNQGR